MEEEWRSQFNSWCQDKFLRNKNTSAALGQESISHILTFLQEDRLPANFDRQQKATFKHKVTKEKKYSWCTIPAVGNLEHETVLTVPATKGGNGTLVVVPVEKFFTTLKAIHENSGHARTTTMWKKVSAQYAGLPKSAVTKFLEGCIGCQCRAPQVNEAEPRQIVATEVFSRVQVDLIDMTMKPSTEFRYILHLMDHFSKFHLISPLARKSAAEVNSALTKMFGTIGLPHILQTDNGSEFAKLGDIFRNQVNTAHSTVIDSTPYEVVYGRQPKLTPLFGREGLVVEDGDPDEHEHSYSTAYDVEDCDQRNSEVEDAQPVSAEDQEAPTTSADNTTEVEDAQPVSAEDQEAPTTSADYTTEVDDAQPVSPEDQEAPTTSADNTTEVDDGQPVSTEDQGAPTTSADNTTEVDDGQPVSTEDQGAPTTSADNTTEVENGQPVSTEDQETPTTSADNTTESEGSGNSYLQSEGSGPSRHESVRQLARDKTLKANERRKNPKKKGKRTDKISVGSHVTIAVPKEDRHRSDQRRLPGIVVDKRGESRASYKIRCLYGVIEGWYGADSIQLFKGPLSLVVEGWEECDVLPLRTAAARQRGSSTLATRCGCKAGCRTNQCACRKEGNSCNTTCHAGRPCSNRISAAEETDTSNVHIDPPTSPSPVAPSSAAPSPAAPSPAAPSPVAASPAAPLTTEESMSDNHPFGRTTMRTILPVMDCLKQSFSERHCEEALNLLRGVTGPNVLRYVASEVVQYAPAFPVQKPHVYRASELLHYGSGYMKYMPAQMRTSHKLYNVSDENNRCLYNSISVMLYGDQVHSSILKLGSVLTGILQMERIILEVLESVKTTDDVIAWAAGFASDAIVESLSGDPEYMVSRIVELELLASLSDNDSGPVQMIALSYFLERQLEVHCCEENSTPVQKYGHGRETLTLVRVPLNRESVDGQIRYNHFVPAIKRTVQEERDFVAQCGAGDIAACNFDEDRAGLEWAQCDDCGRWFHSLCLIDSTRGHTMKRQQTLKCGCLRNGPYKPSSVSILTDLKIVNRVLREHRPFLKELLLHVLDKKVPSWRADYYHQPGKNGSALGFRSGLTFPSETVTQKLRQFIQQQMPGPVSPRTVDLILYPELLIRLFIIQWGLNKVEAEYMIHQMSAGNRHRIM